MHKRLYHLSALVFFVGGCSGHVYHAADPTTSTTPVEGVPYYSPVTVIQQSESSTLVDSKGNVIGNLDGSNGLLVCQPIITEQITSIQDLSKPLRIWFEPGFLESYTFGVTRDSSGALLSVNSVSTPDQGTTVKNLAGAAASVAPLLAVPAPERAPQKRQAVPSTTLADF